MAGLFTYQTLWGSGPPPDFGGGSAELTLGLRIRFGVKGRVVGLRAYLDDSDDAPHFGLLCDGWNVGTPIAGVAFRHQVLDVGGGFSGHWRHAYFSKMVEVAANTELTVMVWFPQSRFYSWLGHLNGAEHNNGDLTAPETGDGGDNGIYTFGNGWALPNTFEGNMYAVDVLYLTDAEAQRGS